MRSLLRVVPSSDEVSDDDGYRSRRQSRRERLALLLAISAATGAPARSVENQRLAKTGGSPEVGFGLLKRSQVL
jgi:hypothetical protein